MGMGALWAVLALVLVAMYAAGSRVETETLRPIRVLSEREKKVIEAARKEMEASEDSLF